MKIQKLKYDFWVILSSSTTMFYIILEEKFRTIHEWGLSLGHFIYLKHIPARRDYRRIPWEKTPSPKGPKVLQIGNYLRG